MPVPLPQFEKKKKVKDLQPLFKKTFRTADYLYADADETQARTAELEKNDKKKEKKSAHVELPTKQPTKGEKTTHTAAVDAKDAAEYEETMVALMETVESKPSPDGPIVTMQEDLWQRFKRFSSSMITFRQESEREIKEAKMKLTQYKELGNLERRIAELQSHRIELIRELAVEEQGFADSFRLRSKLTEVLGQTDQWRTATKDMFKHIHNDKKTADMLRRGINSIENHSAGSKKMDRSENVDRSAVFREGRVIHRTTRMLNRRYYIVTIYTHDQDCKEYTKDMPYSNATQSSSVWSDEGVERQEFEGMAELLAATDGAPKIGQESVSPVYLIVLYDVGSKDYYMLEHLPAKNWSDPRASEKAVINLVRTQLYLKLVGTKQVPFLPTVQPPMREVWSGKREIEGDRPGSFHVIIYGLDMKTWLIRVHDHTVCKLYSHVVPKDLMCGEDDDINDDDDDGNNSERVALALHRLRFVDGVLSIAKAPPPERVDPAGPMREVTKTVQLQSIKTSESWPSNLVLNLASRLGPDGKYMLVRASASPLKDILGIVVYEPIGKLILEQMFTFSEIIGKQIDYCRNTGVGGDLVPMYMKMRSCLKVSSRATATQLLFRKGSSLTEDYPAEEDPELPLALQQLEHSGMHSSESTIDGTGKNVEPAKRITRRPSVTMAYVGGLGITEPEYMKAMEAIFKNLTLSSTNELSLNFDIPDSDFAG